jgi:hypothetical protein
MSNQEEKHQQGSPENWLWSSFHHLAGAVRGRNWAAPWSYFQFIPTFSEGSNGIEILPFLLQKQLLEKMGIGFDWECLHPEQYNGLYTMFGWIVTSKHSKNWLLGLWTCHRYSALQNTQYNKMIVFYWLIIIIMICSGGGIWIVSHFMLSTFFHVYGWRWGIMNTIGWKWSTCNSN